MRMKFDIRGEMAGEGRGGGVVGVVGGAILTGLVVGNQIEMLKRAKRSFLV